MKRKLFLVILVFSLLSVMASAAICNLGSLGEVEITDPENIESGNIDLFDSEDTKNNDVTAGPTNDNDDSDSSIADPGDTAASNSSENNSSSSNSSQDNSGSSNSGSNSDDNTKKGNNPPVINNISFSSDVFSPNKQYTLTCDVSDPDNDDIYYEWYVDGGSTNDFESPSPVWTTPDQEGVYIIELRVSDGWGGYDTKTEMVAVGNVSINAPPVINYIAVYPDGPKYTNNTYKIYCNVTDPNSATTAFDFSVTGGILHDQDANYIDWDTPLNEGTYTITVSVHDKEGNVVTDSHDIFVEAEWIGVADIKVHGGDTITTNSSYNVEGIIVDPKGQISSFKWNCTGGQFSGQNGRHVTWETPNTPGTYTLTLEAKTLTGDSFTGSESFTVVSQ